MTKEKIFEILKNKGELIPETYDGSYEWMKETISSYSKLDSLKTCDIPDLNAIYMLAVGTWKSNVEKKKENIMKTCLPDSEKQRVISIINMVWEKANRYEYQNEDISEKPRVGMFGTGFYSFEGKTTSENVKRFVQMLVDVNTLEDDDAMFSRVEEVTAGGFKGMGSAVVSMILHCLKPYSFPILNGNMNEKNAFEILGIELDHKSTIETYIENCRRIKKYRDDNFSFKNYRVFDAVALFERKAIGDYTLTNREDIGMHDKNIILYGPPGTGKTYNTVNYAVAICENKKTEDIQKEEYDDVRDRYENLKKNGRIAFTTFHQSYGYEEFIEGISPILDEDSEGIEYRIKDGVFKAFCERAKLSGVDEINYNATTYIVRLNGLRDNELKKECFRDDVIRFDWSADASEESVLYKWFKQMSVGDYVLSYYDKSQNIDAVGMVTGEDVFYDESKSSFRWTREVKWLATGFIEDVVSRFGGKWLSNFQISKVNWIRVSDVLGVARQYGKDLPNPNGSPCVFIIDEINRGNISKVFGELITLIEPTKRLGANEESTAILPYSGQEFGVPDNVYILGTMNTADRSIAIMDTALRRRFSFVECMHNESV